MEIVLNILSNEYIMGIIIAGIFWLLGRYLNLEALSPVARKRMKLILGQLAENFNWVEANAEGLGVKKYEKLAVLMERITREIKTKLGDPGAVLTPHEQEVIAHEAAAMAEALKK